MIIYYIYILLKITKLYALPQILLNPEVGIMSLNNEVTPQLVKPFDYFF